MDLTLYLYELQKVNNVKTIIDKNNPNAPIFKWRNKLYKDLHGKFCEDKTCELISYSLVDSEKKPKWRGDTECIGGLVLIVNPKKEKTEGYRVNAMIIFLFVQDDYRGSKFGASLVKQVVKKYKKVFLTTDKRSTQQAKHIYKKIGFKIIGRDGTLQHWIIGVY